MTRPKIRSTNYQQIILVHLVTNCFLGHDQGTVFRSWCAHAQGIRSYLQEGQGLKVLINANSPNAGRILFRSWGLRCNRKILHKLPSRSFTFVNLGSSEEYRVSQSQKYRMSPPPSLQAEFHWVNQALSLSPFNFLCRKGHSSPVHSRGWGCIDVHARHKPNLA